MKENPHKVEVSRMTTASAADLLRDYEKELKYSRTEGDYTREVSETIKKLDAALGTVSDESHSVEESE